MFKNIIIGFLVAFGFCAAVAMLSVERESVTVINFDEGSEIVIPVTAASDTIEMEGVEIVVQVKEITMNEIEIVVPSEKASNKLCKAHAKSVECTKS